jgi:phosphoglycerate dehydrogenase-like enzyme
MREVVILSTQRTSAAERARIAAVDPRVRLIDATGWFDREIRDGWNDYAAGRFLPHSAGEQETRGERARLLAEAEIIVGGWPFPRDLRARARRLKWVHQRQAGASNFFGSDLWGSEVIVTTSRGEANSLPIAEYAVAGMLYVAKSFDRAEIDRAAGAFDHRAYRPWLIDGKTALVVGAGGIGQEVGRLCAALGMRVLGTRRTPPRPGAALPPGFSEIGGADAIDRFLPESDVVAICCQLTHETAGLMNRRRFAAMKPGAVLVNVARGEIIDEDALADALDAGRLRGVVLDVYAGEFERPPPARLWRHPLVLITPHVSGHTDESRHAGIDIFCENLRTYLDGARTLRNVIDWERGY